MSRFLKGLLWWTLTGLAMYACIMAIILGVSYALRYFFPVVI